jgi:AraC-like DNA-binding protein
VLAYNEEKYIEKTIKDVSKRYKVSEKDLMRYFEREMLNI